MIAKKVLPWSLFIIVPLSLGIFFFLFVNQGQGSLEGVRATVLREAKTLPEFSLEDHRSKAFSNENLKGHWSFVFFGYTHCPDICPITLTLLNQVDQVLKKGTDIDLPKTIFISVDPERDTVTQLAEYVSYFNSDFTGVTGSIENLQVLTKSLGIAFGKDGETQGKEYEVFHSSSIMLFDPEARLKALFSSPHDVNQIVYDYSKIIDL